MYIPIFKAPDVLNENLVTSIRHIIDSRIKYFIASLVRKQLGSRKSISKPTAALLSLQNSSKIPTELDDQNLIAPFVDLWESTNENKVDQHKSHFHRADENESSSPPTAKRKLRETESKEEGRMVNDNDFPFDVNERVRRFSTRISSASISFEVPRDGTPSLQSQSTNTEMIMHGSTTLETSTSTPSTAVVCLPLSLVAKVTFDVSIVHALKINVTLGTTGTIQGKFSTRIL